MRKKYKKMLQSFEEKDRELAKVRGDLEIANFEIQSLNNRLTEKDEAVKLVS
jgi:hypothetical protein